MAPLSARGCPMVLSRESPRLRWSLMAAGWALIATLLLLHTLAVRDYLALIDTQGLRGAAVPPTPLRHTLPLIYADAQMWVFNALDLQENRRPDLKLIVTGATREIAIRRMRRALGEFTVEGIKTTIPLQSQIMTTSDFQNGQYDITWVESFLRQEGL